MNNIELKLDSEGHGAFVIEENGQRDAEMVVRINGDTMTVHHTEVAEKLRGKGVARQLLDNMVEHARANNLKVKPLCPYVRSMFERHPDQYEDVTR